MAHIFMGFECYKYLSLTIALSFEALFMKRNTSMLRASLNTVVFAYCRASYDRDAFIRSLTVYSVRHEWE